MKRLLKSKKNSQRSLEQLVELTKRYYVTEKAAQLAKDLELLAKEQELLSDLKLTEKFATQEQEKLNEKFKEIAQELEELQKDNADLKKPVDLNISQEKKQGVLENQEKALEEIRKHKENEQASDTDKMEKKRF